jgi:DNA-binding response OmpR family regulator
MAELRDGINSLTYPGVPERVKVLVVEDDAQLAHLYFTALTLRGMAVARAADGLSALRLVEEFRPHVMILDLMVPTIDGRAVLRDLEAKQSTRHIPVIVVTGMEPTPELPHARVVLRKPCDPDMVARLVSDHLPQGPLPG